ncbi:hypothetical protein CL634_02045 [bacterium]|nr:hypothetical protein [bacterium]
MYKTTKAGFCIKKDFLSAQELLELNGEISSCDLLGSCELGEGENGEPCKGEGLGVIFKKDKLLEVYEKLPSLKPLLDKCLKEKCNIFYFCAIKLQDQGAIAPHFDDNLPKYCDEVHGSDRELPPKPYCTSLFYANVPKEIKGGALFFPSSTLNLTPASNLFVEFGDLEHSVSPIEAPKGSFRLSMALEQYKYLSTDLELFPDVLFIKG